MEDKFDCVHTSVIAHQELLKVGIPNFICIGFRNNLTGHCWIEIKNKSVEVNAVCKEVSPCRVCRYTYNKYFHRFNSVAEFYKAAANQRVKFGSDTVVKIEEALYIKEGRGR